MTEVIATFIVDVHPSVRARMPAFGLIGIRMIIIGLRLQTWMRVIVDVDV